MKNLKFCVACMADQNYDVREEMETYPVKGESITIEANVTYCNVCGEQIWDQELDDKNLVKAFRIYREKHNLLQPEEIKNIREKYGLTQMAFAQILGLGDKTIARYEAGSIQDAAPNTLISLSRYPNVFKEMVETNKVRIPEAIYQSVSERLSEFEPKVIHNGEKIQYKTNANNYFLGDEKMEAGTLDFTPSCSFELLVEQHVRMNALVETLEERAKIEGIDLTMPD